MRMSIYSHGKKTAPKCMLGWQLCQCTNFRINFLMTAILTWVFETLVEASAYLRKLDWLQPHLLQVNVCALEILTWKITSKNKSHELTIWWPASYPRMNKHFHHGRFNGSHSLMTFLPHGTQRSESEGEFNEEVSIPFKRLGESVWSWVSLHCQSRWKFYKE